MSEVYILKSVDERTPPRGTSVFRSVADTSIIIDAKSISDK